MRWMALILALFTLSARAAEVSCRCPAAKEGKTIVIVERRHRVNWTKSAYRSATFPFVAIGTGVYCVVQGPRMLAEWIAFGHIGENFTAKYDKDAPEHYPPGKAPHSAKYGG